MCQIDIETPQVYLTDEDVSVHLQGIIEVLEDKKALDLVSLDLRDRSAMADYFVVCSGNSRPHTRALAEAGFRDDADGLLTLQKLMTNELYAQHYSLGDQLSWYSSINKMLKDGISLEEATIRATFTRLESTKKGLSDTE